MICIDLRICNGLSEKQEINQTRCVLNVMLASLKILDLPFNPSPGTYSLVNIKDLDPHMPVEMKYATENNFLKKKVYQTNECFLQRQVALKLTAAKTYLEKRGLVLKCLDCYRPLSVQKEMWKIKPDTRYVANPKTGSSHNRGIAVDVTLVDALGRELEMPTEFDEFSKEASRDYDKLPDWQKENRDLLRKAMERFGFTSMRTEWWHFEGASSKDYPLLTESLSDIE